MQRPEMSVVGHSESVLSTNKVIRNTYMLLSMTLLFSALMATVSVVMAMPPITYIVCVILGFVTGCFVLPKFANSGAGVGLVFLTTGLFGFALGPILSLYLSLPNGSQIVTMALGGTGVIFFALSAYAVVSRKDFSFMGAFVGAGMLVVLVAMIANIFLALPMLSLALSAGIMLLMSGMILMQTSSMVHGGETNYIMATVSLYLAFFNMFLALLQLLGFAGGDD